MRVGSLFAGIGGFDLGLERAGMEIRWQVENNLWCQRVLAKHWPNVTRYGDIKQVDWHTIEPVDLVCGGFPCQDISLAGKGAGLTGERSSLWFEYAKAIEVLKPRYVIIENVSALRARGLDQMLGQLATLGYDAEWHCVPASAVGAPHRRDRVWVIAYPAGQGPQRHGAECELGQSQSQMQISRSDWWACEPGVQRVAHGIPHRVDRLRGLGNAVVPQVVEVLGRMMIEVEHASLV